MANNRKSTAPGALKCMWTALLFASVLAAQTQLLNRNLVVNGDAEAGPAAQSAGDPQVTEIPKWTRTGGFSVGVYDGGSFLSSTDYGPTNRGSNFFYGGPGDTPATAVQTIDLSAAAPFIDTGRLKYYLTGDLGIIFGNADGINAINLKAEFLDASGSTLLVAVAAGPAAVDVNVAAGLLLRTATGFLPVHARQARITIDLASGSSGYNGYAADNILFVLKTDAMIGVNLLVNGDAEAGGAQVQTIGESPVWGWNGHTSFGALKYEDMKTPPSPAPTSAGKYLLTCPTNQTQCKAFQTVDISPASTLVDEGRVSYQLSGWLGGDDTPDTVGLNVTFYDASRNALAAGADLGPVTLADRNNTIAMVQKSAGGNVPVGTRYIRATLTFTRNQDSDYLAAYADQLSLVLNAVQVAMVTNAASGIPGSAVPGEFVALYGTGLGPPIGVTSKYLDKGLGGTKVTFNGIEAFLTYASATQINAIVPYGVTDKADAVVEYNNQKTDFYPLSPADSSPGIFTTQYGTGPAWAINSDYTFNSATNPAARGTWIAFWVTGQGLVDPAGTDGEKITTAKNVKLPVTVSIGGKVVKQGMAGFWAGLIYTGEIQVNAPIPADAPTGEVELLVKIGNWTSPTGVTVFVK